MKKVISLLLTTLLIISTFSLQIFTTKAEENINNVITKDEISQKYYELYGEDGIIDEDKEYTWDYSEVEETESNNSSNSGISLYWASNEASDPDKKVTHDDIIDAANEMAIENSEDWIPSAYLPLVKSISKICDSSRSDTTESYAQYNTKVIHGQENYFATIYYLWSFARSIKNYESGSITDAVQTANQAGRDVLPTGIKENEKYIKLFHFTKQIVKTHYNDTNLCYSSNQTLGKRCKYIIYGIICHTLGDIYAHRTIAPKNSVNTLLDDEDDDKVVYNSENANHVRKYFNPEDFEKLDTVKLEEMITIIKEGQKYEEDENGVTKDISVTIQGMREYFALKESIANDLSDEEAAELLQSIKASMGSKYIDNGKFYPGRVDEAVWAIEYFISSFSDYDPALVVCAIRPVNFYLKNFLIYETSFYAQ